MPAADPQTLPPSGWYQDPTDEHRQRWWTGASWTDSVTEQAASTSIGGTLLDPEPEPEPSPAEASYVPMAHYDASAWESSAPLSSTPETGTTIAIWLLVLSPILALIVTSVQTAIFFASVSTVPSLATVFAIGSVVVIVEIILFAAIVVWDYVTLKRRGLPAANPAWILLSPLAYFIVRHILLKRFGAGSSLLGVFLYTALAIGCSIGSYFIPVNAANHLINVASVQEFETSAEQQLKKVSGITWAVDCPDDAPASTTGATFTCFATAQGGQRVTMTVEVTSPHAFKITGAVPT